MKELKLYNSFNRGFPLVLAAFTLACCGGCVKFLTP